MNWDDLKVFLALARGGSVLVAAQALGISHSTVSRWKAAAKKSGDDWQLSRSAHLVAGEGLDSIFAMVIEDFALFAQATIADLKNDDEMEAGVRAGVLVSGELVP